MSPPKNQPAPGFAWRGADLLFGFSQKIAFFFKKFGIIEIEKYKRRAKKMSNKISKKANICHDYKRGVYKSHTDFCSMRTCRGQPAVHDAGEK